MLLVLLVGTLVLWACGALLVTAMCWAARRGDEQEIAMPAVRDARPATADPALAAA